VGSHIEDQGEGQRFVVTCDVCGAEIVGTDLADRDTKRAEGGWTQHRGDQDKCPSCGSPVRAEVDPYPPG
jgi:endogenous inhibitor of DNA gyrase (YacG/DUF329 family)